MIAETFPLQQSRDSIVSSYTIVKGSMIEETYSVMAAWNFSLSKRENLDHLRRRNYIEAKSLSWLNDVAKVLNRRFDPGGRDRTLATLAKSGCSLDEWKPLLLWHLTRDEFLLKDFLIYWLFSACYDSDAYSVQYEDLQTYLLNIGKRGGLTEHAWTSTTMHRVASGLLRAATDFGLIKGRRVREFVPSQLPERSFIYMLHVLLDKYTEPKKVINALEWRMFLLLPSDVEKELLRLHQKGKIEFQSLPGEMRISLPQQSLEDYIETFIQEVISEASEASNSEGEFLKLEVHADSTVGLECAYYSVPHQYRGKKVVIELDDKRVNIFNDAQCIATHKRDLSKQMARHAIPEHLPSNDEAYQEPLPQKILLQAKFISTPLHRLIEDLFAKDVLGHLRRAQKLVHRAHVEVKRRGHKDAEPRIRIAVKEMRKFNDFRVRQFEEGLRI